MSFVEKNCHVILIFTSPRHSSITNEKGKQCEEINGSDQRTLREMSCVVVLKLYDTDPYFSKIRTYREVP